MLTTGRINETNLNIGVYATSPLLTQSSVQNGGAYFRKTTVYVGVLYVSITTMNLMILRV